MSRTLSRFLQHAFCGVFHHSKLHYPVRGGYLDEVKLLLEGGDEVNVKSATGVSPLHMAAYYRSPTSAPLPSLCCCRGLVLGGPSQPSYFGHSPPTYYDDQAAVRALQDAGSELDIKTMN